MKTKILVADLYDSMGARGITFNKHSKNEVVKILESTNYYYKVASFRKNFPKNNNIYVNCDFSDLIDLATIDMHVRNYLLQMSLSTEHFIKTELTRLITINEKEDGYSLVEEYQTQNPSQFDHVIRKFTSTKYQKEMLEKRLNDMPIWALMEHMDFSELMTLVSLYYFKYDFDKVKSLEKAVSLSASAKNIRNVCAHNSVYLLGWFNNRYIIKNNASITNILPKVGIDRNESKYAKVNDLIALFSLFKRHASKGTINHFHKSGKELLERWKRNNTYENIPNIRKMYGVLDKLVAFLDI